MCLICACMYIATQLQLYTLVNTCNIQCCVVSDNLFANYLFSLLFIAIPTPLFKFKFLKNLVCILP